jgi:hypothetical protein
VFDCRLHSRHCASACITSLAMPHRIKKIRDGRFTHWTIGISGPRQRDSDIDDTQRDELTWDTVAIFDMPAPVCTENSI